MLQDWKPQVGLCIRRLLCQPCQEQRPHRLGSHVVCAEHAPSLKFRNYVVTAEEQIEHQRVRMLVLAGVHWLG